MNTFPYIILLKGKLFVIELPEKPVEPPQYIDFKNGPDEALKRMEIGGDVFGYERKLKAYESARSAAIEKAVEVENPELIFTMVLGVPFKKDSPCYEEDKIKEGEEVRWPGTWEKKFQHRTGNREEWIETNEFYFIHLASIPGSQKRQVARLIAPEPFKTNQEEEDHLKQFTEKPLLDAIHSDTEEKPDIERLLYVCHKLINSFNGTSKEVPTSLYMRLVDAVSLFNNYKPEPLVSESQLQEERDSFAIGFAKWIDKGPYFLHGLTTWKSVDVREPIITDNELIDLYKETLKT